MAATESFPPPKNLHEELHDLWHHLAPAHQGDEDLFVQHLARYLDYLWESRETARRILKHAGYLRLGPVPRPLPGDDHRG